MKTPCVFFRFLCFLLTLLYSFFVSPLSTASHSANLNSLDGRWLLTLEDDARRMEMPADLRIDSGAVANLVLLGKTDGEPGLFTGLLDGNRLSVKGNYSRRPAEISLRVSGNRMAGRITGDLLEAEIYATRSLDAGTEVSAKRYEALLGAVLNGVTEHFYDPRLNGVNLNALRARHLPKVKAARNEGELVVAIRKMLAELNASHLEFFYSLDQAQIVHKQEPIVWRQIEPGIGYLALLGFPAENLRDFDSLLNLAMSELVKNPALVIDLRGNRGERLDSALAALNIILPEGHPVAFFATRQAMSRMNISSIDRIDPSTLPSAYAGDNRETAKFQGAGMYLAGGKFKSPYHGRIALLVDEGCRGSCELFAAAMQEAHQATLFGRRTRGSMLLSIPVNFTIIGWMGFPRDQVRGWQLEVPTTEVRTAGGAKIEGRGVEPDIVVERMTTNDADLARVLEWLNGKP